MLKYKLILLTILLFAGFASPAQQTRISAKLEKDSILIGDQITFDLLFTGPAKAQVNWPFFQDTLTSEIEIINSSGLDSARKNNLLELSQQYTITSFDSGTHSIGPFRIAFSMPDDTTSYIGISDIQDLHVLTVPVDTTKAIKPIKGPMDAPLTFAEILPWLLTGIGLLIIAAAIWYYTYARKRAKPLIPVRQKPKLPPHIQALNDLEQLKQKKLWQEGKLKEYYTELTDIIRIYIEERFDIMAMEMTSFEIMEHLQALHPNGESLEKIASTFSLADMVKFAKEKPLPSDNDTSWLNAKYFVENSFRRKEENEPEEENKALTEKVQKENE